MTAGAVPAAVLRPSGGPRYHDLFCGAGGSSIGLSAAGMELVLAANHWDRAIETHSANFPHAEHLCEDINRYDMRRLPAADVLWASPICTEASPAGGRRRTRGQLDMLEEYGYVAPGAMERTRATFHDVIRATEVHRYKLVFVENVVDVATAWELFDWWVDGMRQLRPGYEVQFVSVSAAHVGDETNQHAPQWRDRLYMVFNRRDVRPPNVDPRPLAWCQVCDEIAPAVQSWKRPERRRIGKYGQQYVYRCPNTTCRHAVVEPFVLPAAAAIDWSDIGQRIGDRARPLAAATMRRIQAGLDMFAEPHTVPSGGTWRTDPASLRVPMPTRTASETDALVCPPFMTSVNHDDVRTYPVDARPLPARTAKIGDGLICPPLVGELRRNAAARPADGAPLYTVAAGGSHHYLTVPPGAFYVKHFTPRGQWSQMAKDAATEPLGSITSKDHHSLVIPYRRGSTPHLADAAPLSTVATREQHGLASLAIDIDDCYFRMLQPREHLRAQRFHDEYVVTGNKGEQTMQAGNAVSANVAQWLGKAGIEVLS